MPAIVKKPWLYSADVKCLCATSQWMAHDLYLSGTRNECVTGQWLLNTFKKIKCQLWLSYTCRANQ